VIALLGFDHISYLTWNFDGSSIFARKIEEMIRSEGVIDSCEGKSWFGYVVMDIWVCEYVGRKSLD
jgi:hypothetical protein